MIRFWFRALARKCMSGRQQQATSRAPRRLGACLRLEALEDRTVMSTLQIDPPVPLPEAVRGGEFAAGWGDATKGTSGDSASSVKGDANAPSIGGPGLDRLLEDLEKLETPPEDSGYTFAVFVTPPKISPVSDPNFSVPPSQSAPGALAQPPARDFGYTIGTFVGDAQGWPANDRNASPPRRPSDSGATPQPDAQSLSADGVEKAIAQSSPSTQPVTDANAGKSTSADSGRTPPARPGDAPEAQTAPTGPSPNRPSVANGDQPTAQQAPQSDEPGTPDARPRRDNAGRAASETKGTVPQSRQAGTAPITAPRAEGQGLPADLPDGMLLRRFVAGQEQAAFTALVQRHERSVLGVCQRVLGDSHAAQDAFQATFMVLARKAGMFDKHSHLAGWLYKVAYYVALRLRAVTARQRHSEKQAANGRATEGVSEWAVDIERQEMRQALREELQHLPEKYRLPLVLCYLDGRTHDEVAREIGLPRGSIAKRIGEGLERLRERLIDRGLIF
jgi:RNA polymerase sigma factor (sigma-70 family)